MIGGVDVALVAGSGVDLLLGLGEGVAGSGDFVVEQFDSGSLHPAVAIA